MIFHHLDVRVTRGRKGMTVQERGKPKVRRVLTSGKFPSIARFWQEEEKAAEEENHFGSVQMV